MRSDKFIYRCTDCGKEYPSDNIMYLCPACSAFNKMNQPPRGTLKTVYDYSSVRRKYSSVEGLRSEGFISLLPINSEDSLPPLRTGNTPLHRIESENDEGVPFSVFFKNESQNPTWSLEDRSTAIVSAFAREQGISTLVASSAGNIGSSLAALCPAQKQKAVIIMPEHARLPAITHMLMCGATVIPVIGSNEEAFDLSVTVCNELGLYNCNTVYNPLTVEGKKTVAFELFEQTGHRIPDRVFVPAGDGAGVAAIYKGFEELMLLNITDKMPVIVAVQSDKSDNIVRNLKEEIFTVKKSATLAESISVNIPRAFYMLRKYMADYQGEAITVSDEEIILASKQMGNRYGLFGEPATAAAFAGLFSYGRQGKLEAGSLNVVIVTATGLKDFRSMGSILKLPLAVEPETEKVKQMLSGI